MLASFCVSKIISSFCISRRTIQTFANKCTNLKMENILKPPESVKGLTHLDRNLFEKEIEVCYFLFKDKRLSNIIPLIKKYLLTLKKFKPLQKIDENQVEIYLNPVEIQQWSSFPNEIQERLKENHVEETDLYKKQFLLKYDYFTVEDVLRAVLPEGKEGSSSYTQIGHIVHVNLREHLLSFKMLIGEVLYDKVSGCKSVVNKTNNIDNTYRNFQMEILKGDSDMLTTIKENNCSFKFDFSKVYWNSRLCTEHERIVEKLNRNDVLFDVFAGVGPFAVPAAKKKCYVFANDLNPESFNWLVYNFKANKIKEEYFKAFNKDGRDFIKEEIRQYLPQYLTEEYNIFITMNLPGLATEFLDAFVGLFNTNELTNLTEKNCPVLIVYCFSKGVDYTDIAKNLVTKGFGFDISEKIIDIFRVRTVSSLKEMMRVTVKLDKDILTGNSRKRKLDDDFDNICDRF